MKNEKLNLRNKQDQEIKDRFKHLNRQIEKKPRRALKDTIIKNCQQCEDDFRRGNSQLMFKHAKELAYHKDTNCLDLLDKNGSAICLQYCNTTGSSYCCFLDLPKNVC